MAKEFAARQSKKDRKIINNLTNIDDSILKLNDQKLLRGAQLDNIPLKDIFVREQVRTKFNDASIKELAENIRENGLIQPLVIHREGNKFFLICGERRFRAMNSIDMKEAPCFILENKTSEELMAIQFSENQAREELHYIDQADSIWGYQKITGASERKITAALGISKSEVHRCLRIAKLTKDIKEAAKIHNTEKYVLLEWNDLPRGENRKILKSMILNGEITKRIQLKRQIRAMYDELPTKSVKRKKNIDDLYLKMKSEIKDPKLRAKAAKMMKDLIKENTLQ